jgi:hypothetical protein
VCVCVCVCLYIYVLDGGCMYFLGIYKQKVDSSTGREQWT